MWRFLRIRKDRVMLLAALGLAVCAGLAAGGYWYFVSPTRLTVAVAPRDGVEERLIRAYAEALVSENRDIRLRVVPYDGVKESAEALRQKKADLAVVRPDVALPPNGATVAILREEAVILVVPGPSLSPSPSPVPRPSLLPRPSPPARASPPTRARPKAGPRARTPASPPPWMSTGLRASASGS